MAKKTQPRINIEKMNMTRPMVGTAVESIIGINSNNEKEVDLLSKFKKKSFKDLHQQESFFIKNNLHETFFSLLDGGSKGLKTELINVALEEFFKNHQIEVLEYTGKYATGTRRKNNKVNNKII